MKSELFSHSFPEISVDSRLILRELSLEDAYEYYRFMSHPEVAKYLADEDIPTSVEHAKHELNYWINLFHKKYSIYWGIALKDNNLLIGTCGFNNWNIKHDRVEISYDISFDYWNQGIATKCVEKLTEYAFNKMGALRIQATVERKNFGSLRVLAKNGYEREGLLKKYAKLQGIQKDFYMYSKTI